MAQILALARKPPAADASMKRGVWDKKSFMGEEIRGKVLGLAGLGRIGLAGARRARAFEMIVIAHDPFVAPEIAEELGIAMVSLDNLCARGGLPVAPSAVDRGHAAHLQRRSAGGARKGSGSSTPRAAT